MAYTLGCGWSNESSCGSNAKITRCDFVLVESLHIGTIHDENISLKDAINRRWLYTG
jgi:hypothetical protein